MKTKKVWLVSLLALLLAAVLAGCGSFGLPEGVDEDDIAERTRQAIGKMGEGDYAGVNEMFREDVQAQVTVESWEELFAMPEVVERGAYEDIDSITVAGTKQDGEHYAVAVAVCRYENGTLTHRLTYDDTGALVGYFINEK